MSCGSDSPDARQLERMLACIAEVRAERISLLDAANTLLFLRDALDAAPRDWARSFTSHVVTLESAALASTEQKATMGSRFQTVVSDACSELEKLARNHPCGIAKTS